MAARLLISDANIIIDMNTGGLLRLMFRFDATFWLIEQMVKARTITVRQAEAGYAKMREAGRRLPWDDVDHQVRSFKRPVSPSR